MYVKKMLKFNKEVPFNHIFELQNNSLPLQLKSNNSILN